MTEADLNHDVSLDAATDWSDEAVRPIYEIKSKNKLAYATPVAGRVSHSKWENAEAWESVPSSTAPHPIISSLVRGRISPASFYAKLGDKDLLPIMSASEIGELVGIASPTVLHLRLIAAAMHVHVGEPKIIRGQECWLVAPRFNDDVLDPALAKAFPLPENDRYAAVYPVLQAAGASKRRIKIVPAEHFSDPAIDEEAPTSLPSQIADSGSPRTQPDSLATPDSAFARNTD